MFRVNITDEPSRTVITIDGQLSGESIQLVETCCDQAISKGKPVRLFLRDMVTIDRAARAVLRQITSKGVHLVANGVYTAHLALQLMLAGGEVLNASVVNRNPHRPPTRRE